MVFVIKNPDPDVFHAYLITSLSPEQLNKIHEDFEYGSQARVEPCMRLHIHDFRQHAGKSHAEIRRLVSAEQRGAEDGDVDDDAKNEEPEVVEAEDDEEEDGESGWEDEPQPGDFLLIDDEYKKSKAIWFVQDFATEEEVSEKQAVSTDVLWEISMMVMDAPQTKLNYDIGNMDIQEDLGQCRTKFPFQNGNQKAHWSLPLSHYEGEFDTLCANICAAPGEFEESRKEADRKVLHPMPEKVARLKPDKAKEVGVVPGWTVPNSADERYFVGLKGKKFAKGSMVLYQSLDLDFERPPYERVPASL